ncbi:hypothetical protein RFI_19778 [Reticulomyxa filosa]|uniref:Uncharacterized protein n=1 Tax=Reticulomyxa filosa TaxID=46433 RepID=X6MUP0_RETFI|nr:hypothetical protein RFI_19778 [Reticulomyxa filosa]|eukprot:ETO17544.1 hypothetical protein RFI_19778 [Reticulomyxa filosa]
MFLSCEGCIDNRRRLFRAKGFYSSSLYGFIWVVIGIVCVFFIASFPVRYYPNDIPKISITMPIPVQAVELPEFLSVFESADMDNEDIVNDTLTSGMAQVSDFEKAVFTEVEHYFSTKENSTLFPILRYDYELFWWTNTRASTKNKWFPKQSNDRSTKHAHKNGTNQQDSGYISIITQCTIDRLPMLKSMLLRWTGGVNVAIYLFPEQNTNATRGYLERYFDLLYRKHLAKQINNREINVALVYPPRQPKWSIDTWIDRDGVKHILQTLHPSMFHSFQPAYLKLQTNSSHIAEMDKPQVYQNPNFTAIRERNNQIYTLKVLFFFFLNKKKKKNRQNTKKKKKIIV